jgi:hypothetical protein
MFEIKYKFLEILLKTKRFDLYGYKVDTFFYIHTYNL